MEVKSKISGNVLICYVKGELDHHTCEEFRNYVDYHLENNPVRHLILDLSGLDFTDSSGIGVIIGRYKKVTGLGGKMVVIGENKQVSKVFGVSGIYEIIPSRSSINDALKEL